MTTLDIRISTYSTIILHFAPVIICVEPGLLSPHAGIGQFLQVNVQSVASDLFSPLTFISTSITSFYLFFGLPFFEQYILNFIATDSKF